MSGDQPSLPINRAFVVQFYADTNIEEGLLRGRTEHVVSGQAAHFASVEELLAFISRVLAAVKQSEVEG